MLVVCEYDPTAEMWDVNNCTMEPLLNPMGPACGSRQPRIWDSMPARVPQQWSLSSVLHSAEELTEENFPVPRAGKRREWLSSLYRLNSGRGRLC